jgi:hypothetical protein
VLRITEINGTPIVFDQPDESVLLINAMDWHLRYGHLPFPSFRHIPEAPRVLKFSTYPCDACSTGKSTKPLNYPHGIRTTQPLHLIHSDLCGPISPIAYNGLREKRNSQGEIIKYKARLTGRGFTQIKGLHYNETYAPVARPESWRTFLAIAIQNQWDIEQLDIVAAYLNSILHHEIYIKDPKVTGGKVWKLVKALYGLKKSAYEWNGELTTVLHHAGLVPLNSDPACYHGKDSTGNYDIFIATHVDDLLVIASSQEQINRLILSLEISLEVEPQ